MLASHSGSLIVISQLEALLLFVFGFRVVSSAVGLGGKLDVDDDDEEVADTEVNEVSSIDFHFDLRRNTLLETVNKK